MAINKQAVEIEGIESVMQALANIRKEMKNDRAFTREVLSPAARPVRQKMRQEVSVLKNADVFKVYRTPKFFKGIRAPRGKGRVAYEIKSGNLKKSIGLFTTRKSRRQPAVYVGPRYTMGRFKDPEIGGWYLNIVQVGTDKIPASPFVTKTYNLMKTQTASTLEKLSKKRLTKVVSIKGKKAKLILV